MVKWNKRDVGKVIVYRNKIDSCLDSKETIAICKVYLGKNNSISVINYPITLSSRYFPLELIKDNKKKDDEYLKRVGDWYLEGRVSKEEANVLEKLARE